MNTFKRYLITLGLGTALGGLLTATLIIAASSAGNQLEVVATIEPHRIVVVDSDLIIQEIVSNTTDDVRPTVVLGTEDGQEIAYGDAVNQQYQSLKPNVDFSKPGVVYRHNNSPVVDFFHSVGQTLLKWISRL